MYSLIELYIKSKTKNAARLMVSFFILFRLKFKDFYSLAVVIKVPVVRTAVDKDVLDGWISLFVII